jgi:N-hydroxyarylamine O-acetyltransferase
VWRRSRRRRPSSREADITDEWTIDELDLAAYLRRIGYEGDGAPTGDTLTELHRAHLDAIGFENLDIVLGHGISVDLPDIQAKLVDRGRGGYCYEHGVLFAAVLARLGFGVQRLLARVGGLGEQPRPRTHMTLLVSADSRQWLADVGFGTGLLEPLPMDVPGPHEQGGWAFDLQPDGDDGWNLLERRRDEWLTGYWFDAQRQHPADVVMANHFTATWPRSPFVGQIVASRKDEASIHRLAGRTLTVMRPDGSTYERELDDAELADVLRDLFGLPLSDDELAALVAQA